MHFLSRFLETCMFSSFVDGKVIARWVDRDPAQHLFDSRLERERLCDTEQEHPRDSRYRKCPSLFESGTSHPSCEIIISGSLRTCPCCKMTSGLRKEKMFYRTNGVQACVTTVNICGNQQQMTVLTLACSQ